MTDTPAPEDTLGFLLYRVGLAVSRAYEAASREGGLRPVETGILSAIAADGPQHVRGLSRRLGVGRQTIVNLTDQLAARGLITKEASTEDARLVEVALTAQGRAALGKARKISARFDAALAEPLTPAREAAMCADLRALLASPLLNDPS